MNVCPTCQRPFIENIDLPPDEDERKARNFVIKYLHIKYGYGYTKLGNMFNLSSRSVRIAIDEDYRKRSLDKYISRIKAKYGDKFEDRTKA
jgi:hypothetical protein